MINTYSPNLNVDEDNYLDLSLSLSPPGLPSLQLSLQTCPSELPVHHHFEHDPSRLQQSQNNLTNFMHEPQISLHLGPLAITPMAETSLLTNQNDQNIIMNTVQEPQFTDGHGSSSSAIGEAENETFHSIYPWATDRRATIRSLDELLSNNILTVTGQVQCKNCKKTFEIEVDIRQKLVEVEYYIVNEREAMHNRAPAHWIKPTLPRCRFCDQENSAKPIIGENDEINWLYLFLSQTLGCCSLNQLKYFCHHARNHRTGAKDRLLYTTYLTLYKQLCLNYPLIL